ncbi:hypothetical protein [Massilia antarctica]|uniref:hypothetical protein n=1 Tax=Massilia antarctica TaxID=2765360 RepID=UPI00226E40C8|nr:hypothetical protein [Massilia sp. H27-R4]MCY0915458.1 hypothetical protein [Massilia sp. H27-R4]
MILDRIDVRATTRNADFLSEFCFILNHRRQMPRHLPTPDQFPLFCELIEVAKKYFASLPRIVRNNSKNISFSYFGREWAIRPEFVLYAKTTQHFFHIATKDPCSRVATVSVVITETWETP